MLSEIVFSRLTKRFLMHLDLPDAYFLQINAKKIYTYFLPKKSTFIFMPKKYTLIFSIKKAPQAIAGLTNL